MGIFSAPAVEADDEDDAEDPLRPPPEDGLASSSFFMREWFVLLLKFLRCIEFVPTVRLCHCDPPQQWIETKVVVPSPGNSRSWIFPDLLVLLEKAPNGGAF